MKTAPGQSGRAVVSVTRYRQPRESVRRAIELCGGLDHLPANARVFIKPNVAFWSRHTEFPKYGVITTSRVVEDVVELLKEQGVDDITLGEGIVTWERKDRLTPADAFERLGYGKLKKRYGVKVLNVFERPFEPVDLGGGVELNFNADFLESDFVVDLPVLKTHAQTRVSLGIKNLKGTIDIPSRKKCHSPDPERDLHYRIARLGDRLPPSLTLIDGIYSLERGPAVEGWARRSDLLVASPDLLSADLVGARLLGQDPAQVPHLVHAGRNRGRPLDLSDVEVRGESLAAVSAYHEPSFAYTPDDLLPAPLAKKGVRGLQYRKYDSTMCTYCSVLNGLVLQELLRAWKGEPWEDVEILTGKAMRPTPGMRKTVLLGNCMSRLHRKDPGAQEAIPVWGCPPEPEAVIAAFHRAGIPIDGAALRDHERSPAAFLKRYAGRPEFDERFYRI
ncbi:MAG: DUF362 domain-containing protein [Deltaproteobacteria bacterium]|nr:DUF362 domain-containing protein [Deltaproteobacteria bacterium]